MILFRFIFFTFIIIFHAKFAFGIENKILFKVENELITSIDIYNQTRYLETLNQEIKNLDNKDIFEISKNSIIREKIKKIEILKNVPELYVEEEILNSFIKANFVSKGINNLNDYKNFVSSLNLEFIIMKEKLIIEILWNNLIFQKFSSEIKINKEDLKKEIKNNKNKVISYNLNEIMFSAKNKSEITDNYRMIKENIEKQGFKKTALVYSISDSADNNGELGWINENSLNKKILEELKKLKIGEYSQPIITPGGFLILMIEDIKEVEKKIDVEKELNMLIRLKTNQQLNQFSSMYFNRVKKDLAINEL